MAARVHMRKWRASRPGGFHFG